MIGKLDFIVCSPKIANELCMAVYKGMTPVKLN